MNIKRGDMTFSAKQWRWILRDLDVIFLIPLIIFIIATILGFVDLMKKYDYLSATINFTSLLGLWFLINNAIERKRHRIIRIIAIMVLFILLVYSSVNYPAFGGTP